MSLAEADILRRAMGKKDLVAMKEQKAKFIDGADAKGISKKIAGEIFISIDKFANYGFNKSHAVAYSYIAYQTAYLKAHYPSEFLAANLTNEFENTDKVSNFLEDCRRLEIEVLPPDVNNASVNFDVMDDRIRFGMIAIKNVGKNAVEVIIKARKKLERNFTSIFDFCINVDTRLVNKRTLEGLVTAGAFDSVDANRAPLYDAIEKALEFGGKMQHSVFSNGDSLFGGMEDLEITEPELQDIKPWSEKERLGKEREAVGFYISGHPLHKFDVEYNSFTNFHIGKDKNINEEDVVKVCGVITGVRKKIDKSGKNMAFFTIDDFSGSCECIMFSKIFANDGGYVEEEESVLVVGKLESSGDAVKIHVNKLMPMDKAREQLTKSINISINKDVVSPEKISLLKQIFEKNKGNTPVFLSLGKNGFHGSLYSLKDYRVKVSEELIKEVTSLFGDGSLRINS
ncbi:MAG: DNA polymerase III subunit alpha, partial [Ignavibacteriaceae bacterium]|nr:DNA polymerase III subunit alpha [Ignavibacteriaceae bacterium]